MVCPLHYKWLGRSWLGKQTLAADAKRVLQQNAPNHPWLTGDWPDYPSKWRTLNPFASEKSAASSSH